MIIFPAVAIVRIAEDTDFITVREDAGSTQICVQIVFDGVLDFDLDVPLETMDGLHASMTSLPLCV